ncbi:hypothetical protein CEXT_579421 [Caerostris extrusa]|uniref:Uncharacterized protein n=1 Tax=Caerostris extrusa TaxID=172846 RepID=A0AAV4P1S6_CAEEX|nr:hypothetical protein CEXT_579421 [Caerostris extrusa]
MDGSRKLRWVFLKSITVNPIARGSSIIYKKLQAQSKIDGNITGIQWPPLEKLNASNPTQSKYTYFCQLFSCAKVVEPCKFQPIAETENIPKLIPE